MKYYCVFQSNKWRCTLFRIPYPIFYCCHYHVQPPLPSLSTIIQFNALLFIVYPYKIASERTSSSNHMDLSFIEYFQYCITIHPDDLFIFSISIALNTQQEPDLVMANSDDDDALLDSAATVSMGIKLFFFRLLYKMWSFSGERRSDERNKQPRNAYYVLCSPAIYSKINGWWAKWLSKLMEGFFSFCSSFANARGKWNVKKGNMKYECGDCCVSSLLGVALHRQRVSKKAKWLWRRHSFNADPSFAHYCISKVEMVGWLRRRRWRWRWWRPG